MSKKFSKAFLMSGKDFELTPYITLHHPTIEEILSINASPFPDNFYWTYVRILLADPYANMVMLDDMGRNYLTTSPYEVFVLQWDKCRADYQENKTLYDTCGINPPQNILNALSFFLKEKRCFEKGSYENGSVCFYDVNDPACQINGEIYDYIYEWVRSLHKIDDSGRIKPADESARRILIEDMRDELKKSGRRKTKQTDDSDYFGSLMSAVSFCGNGSITPFHLRDCKIYWLNEALAISSRKNNADHILDGIYHGTLSSKDINKKEIDWIK